jgi:AAA+ superfamily predicted ATPase
MLRLLEYFSGVLILTTNRVKSIDYAVMSRISYAIKFKELTLEHQKTIYRNFLSQAKKKGLIKAGEKERIDEMVNLFKSKEKLNGRDIRTLFTTAQSRGKGRLTAENMNEIHEQLQSFKDDMNTLYILAERNSVVQ